MLLPHFRSPSHTFSVSFSHRLRFCSYCAGAAYYIRLSTRSRSITSKIIHHHHHHHFISFKLYMQETMVGFTWALISDKSGIGVISVFYRGMNKYNTLVMRKSSSWRLSDLSDIGSNRTAADQAYQFPNQLNTETRNKRQVRYFATKWLRIESGYCDCALIPDDSLANLCADVRSQVECVGETNIE